ncbi:MAG: hypothetical protein DI576_03995 [Actinomyces sp.]|nr:MAG: hypothetical protein DI576_03995 [Actinomyces sp.]
MGPTLDDWFRRCAGGSWRGDLGQLGRAAAHDGRLEPISTRNRTDLGAEPNRSRRGTRPISATAVGQGGTARLNRRRRRARAPGAARRPAPR